MVQSLAQGQREPTDAVLMDVAAALLYVEATLAGMVGNAEPSQREESRPNIKGEDRKVCNFHTR